MSDSSKSAIYRSVGVQNAITRLEAGTTFPRKEFEESGANHAYTCWPDQSFDENDPAAVMKWIKRVERRESYTTTLAIVCRRLETILKANELNIEF